MSRILITILAWAALLVGCTTRYEVAQKPLSSEMSYAEMQGRLGRMKNICIQEGTPKSQIDACVRQNMIAGDNLILSSRSWVNERAQANQQPPQQILQQQPAPVAVFTQKPQITCDTSGGRYIYCQ